MSRDQPPSVVVASSADVNFTAARIATGLFRQGVRAGDRVVVKLPSGHELLSTVLACTSTGVLPVMVDDAATDGEWASIRQQVTPVSVIDSVRTVEQLASAPASAISSLPLTRPMHLTSGTTGRPKVTWFPGPDPKTAARAALAEEAEQWHLDSTTRMLLASPLHHSAPLRFAISTLYAGGTVLVQPRFDATYWSRVGRELRATATFVVPSHLHRLKAKTNNVLPDFALLAHAGAACPDGLKRWVGEAVGAKRVWEFYGSTEGQFTLCRHDEWLERPGTVGRARPGRSLKVTLDGVGNDPRSPDASLDASLERSSETSLDASPEVTGASTVWCRPPDFARFAYWGDEPATRAAWADGWFTVGDHGKLDDAGYLSLSGRREDLIISGGVNVYPAAIEAVLLRCPGVVDVAVFGVPDESWGQRVCAAVVAVASPAFVAEWARTHLSPAKRPKQISYVDDLPRTASGKVLRHVLRASLSEC